MFVQATQGERGNTTYLTYRVRESFRTPQGPRSRTICNITALPPETRELISQSLQGRSFVAAESLQLAEAWNFGGLMVLHQAWEEFGLSTIFDFVADARMAGLLKAMTLGRILFPSAKLALVDHARGTLLAAACGLDQATEDFDEDDLYAAMDQLNGHWVGIEKQLYQKSFPQGVSLVLYVFRCELYAAVLNASVPEYRRESRDGSRSGHRNSSMGSRDGTGRDADLPIRL